VLLDKTAADIIIFLYTNYSIFCFGNGQFHEPELCELYRHTLISTAHG